MNLIAKVRSTPIQGVRVLGGVVVAVMLSGTGMFLTMRLQDNANNLALVHTQYAQSTGQLEEKSEEMTTLSGHADQLRERLESLPTLESAGSYNQRSAAIAASAERARISIDTLQPDAQQSLGRVSWVPIHCSGKGSFDSMMSWITTLEENWPDIVVQDIEMEMDEPGGLLRLRVLLRWYVLSDQTST